MYLKIIQNINNSDLSVSCEILFRETHTSGAINNKIILESLFFRIINSKRAESFYLYTFIFANNLFAATLSSYTNFEVSWLDKAVSGKILFTCCRTNTGHSYVVYKCNHIACSMML